MSNVDRLLEGAVDIHVHFGQDYHPMPAEDMRMGIATLLQAGLPEVEVGLLVKDNPARLLGL